MRNAFFKNLVFLAQIILLVFIAINVFSFSHLGGMGKNSNGSMSGCIFDGRAEICNMSIFDHINNLQNMFTASHIEQNILMLILFLILAVAAIAYRWFKPAVNAKSESLSQKFYILQYPDVPLFNTFRQAFAQGILNPKIYNLAVN